MQSAKFLDGLSGKLAEQWSASLLTPAFAFWTGGVLVGIQRHDWGKAISTILGDPDNNLQIIAVSILGFLLIATSATLIQRFEFVTLRILEGYWPRWLARVRRWAINRQIRQFKQDDERWRTLDKQQENQGLTAEEEDTLARLEQSLRRMPVQTQKLMPTRLGNILRAAELQPKVRYGLDAVVCWPHLWLLLPDQARTELHAARQTLNAGVRAWLWSILFALVWTPFGLLRWSAARAWPTLALSPWALWPAVVGILSAFLAYRWMLEAAMSYGDLIEAAFDLYRTSLYTALRLPLPANSTEEKATGRQITQYLWRGIVGSPVTFQSPSPQKPDE